MADDLFDGAITGGGCTSPTAAKMMPMCSTVEKANMRL